jgi:hypothetical protein
MGVCIVQVGNKKHFGKVLRYDAEKKSYLIELHESHVNQWIPMQYVKTRLDEDKTAS